MRLIPIILTVTLATTFQPPASIAGESAQKHQCSCKSRSHHARAHKNRHLSHEHRHLSHELLNAPIFESAAIRRVPAPQRRTSFRITQESGQIGPTQESGGVTCSGARVERLIRDLQALIEAQDGQIRQLKEDLAKKQDKEG